MNAFLVLQFQSRLGIVREIQRLLEREVAGRVRAGGGDGLAVGARIVDEAVLRIFVQFRLYIKEPYNCVPVWLITFIELLQKKYLDPKSNIPSSQKISLLRMHCKFLTETPLISSLYPSP